MSIYPPAPSPGSIPVMPPPKKRTTQKKPAPPAPPPAVEPTRADGRPKSKLTLAAEQAALEAKRALLLETLRRLDWNLSAASRDLEMAGASDVLRALRAVGLFDEYERNKHG